MSDAKPGKPEANQWRMLLEETRLALSTLRADDLEDLAERAECMLFATVGHDPIRQRMSRPAEHELLEVTREHRLVSDLLIATGGNLDVLRRMRGDNRARGGEANSRWVR